MLKLKQFFFLVECMNCNEKILSKMKASTEDKNELLGFKRLMKYRELKVSLLQTITYPFLNGFFSSHSSFPLYSLVFDVLVSLHLLLNVRFAQDTHADWYQELIIKGACFLTSTCQSINYHRFLDSSEHDSFQDMQPKILGLHLCREMHIYSIDILGIFRVWLTVKVECVISAQLELPNKCKMKAYQMFSSWLPKYSPSSISSLKSNQNWLYLLSLWPVQAIEYINQGCQKLQVVEISNLVVHRKKLV